VIESTVNKVVFELYQFQKLSLN